MNDTIDLKRHTLEELSGVVTLYPWYGAARRELCVRLSRSGDITVGQLADAALYLGAREKVGALLRRKDTAGDYSDKDVRSLLDAFLRRDRLERSPRTVRVAGGDYVTQAQYDEAREEGGRVFSRMAAQARSEAPERAEEAVPTDDLCTETLAQIYAEQGYYQQSRRIYSRLLLKFPEKSAYFASLIEKMDSEIKNN